MSVPPGAILLGTVALEPNRWATVDPSGRPTLAVSHWLPGIAEAGYDGVELWDKHLTQAPPDEAAAVLTDGLPATVFNSYVSFDDAEPAARDEAASWVARAGSCGVKFNVGNNPDLRAEYADRIAQWLAAMPAGVALLCECHHDISIAEDPAVAAAIFDAAGPADRVQAIVHTHESGDHLRARFDAYGDRISHVHVNFLDLAAGGAPRLADVRSQLEAQVELLRALGFDGSWTIEFVHGLLTGDDHPEALLHQAAEDLVVLRHVLA